MNLTVAICTWNRLELLKPTLEEFNEVRVDPSVSWEVLVVDNGSTDGTAKFLATYKPAFPFRWITEPRQGLSAARNRALAESTSELIFFTDDDVLVDRDVLMVLLSAARRHPDAAALGGTIDPWFVIEPDPTLASAFPALRRGFCGTSSSADERPLEPGHHLIGANMAYQRSLVHDLAFRDDLGPCGTGTVGGDEIDFQEKIRARGGTIMWIPQMRVRHYVDPNRMTLEYLLRFAEDAGRKEIRLHGVPPGPRIGGVPRWLLGNALKEHLRALARGIRRNRVDALAHRRRAAEFGGMVKECRSRHVRERQVAIAAVTARP